MKASFATAYTALALLLWTLLIGPWNLLCKRRTPVSTDLRRDVGIWAGILGLLHTLFGQNAHFPGRWWLYYVYQHRPHGPTGLRHDLFGFNNYTGVAATLILTLLFVTSNDWSLRRLGAPKWKQLQRYNYFCLAFSAAHTLGYLFIERRTYLFVASVISLGLVVVLQGMGYRLRSREPRPQTV